MPKFTVFGLHECKWCDKAIDLLEEENKDFEYFEAEGDTRDFLVNMGLNTVPQIFYGAIHIGGYDNLEAFLDNPGDK